VFRRKNVLDHRLVYLFLGVFIAADGAGMRGAALPQQAPEAECTQKHQFRWLVHDTSLPV
jgi:hypothetical protein